MWRALAVAVVLLALGSCGGGGDPDARVVGPATTTTETTTTTERATTTTEPEATTATRPATTTTRPPSTTTTTTEVALPPDEVAEAYALDKSEGEREGCSSAAPGAEAEANPGCIYSVAFGGCYEGLTGERLAPLPVEEEFPTEPGLVALYHQAVEDCAR